MRDPEKTGSLAWRSALVAALAGSALVMVAVSTPAAGQAEPFPARAITLLVPFAAGGSSDVVMRLVSKKASEGLKQTIVIDNRPGGGGNVAAVAVKNALPDGHTLMMGHTGTHAINATLYANLGFDPARDFAPITPLISFNNLLTIPASSPAKSAKELVALAKSRPEGLSYGSSRAVPTWCTCPIAAWHPR